MVCSCFFLASSLPTRLKAQEGKKKAQEGKRGHDSLVKSWVIKYNHYQIVFSESTYMYVVNG